MNKLIFIFMMLPFIGMAQPAENNFRLTKNEQIFLAAYDDTTKALAYLFMEKRRPLEKERKTSAIVFGLSAAALVTGAVMLENDLNNSPAGAYDGANYLGMILALGGTMGSVYGLVGYGVASISMNPYTVKKYHRLLDYYQSNQTLPEFYLKRIGHHLPKSRY
jgi:hypothetical protein